MYSDLTRTKINGLLYYHLIFLCSSLFLIDVVIYQLDHDIGFLMLALTFIPLFFLMNFPHPRLLIFAFILFILLEIACHYSLNPLKNNDSQNYYAYLNAYQSYGNFFNDVISDILHNRSDFSIYNSFGLIYITFYQLFDSADPSIIGIMNIFFLLLTFKLSFVILRDHFNYELQNKQKFLAIFLAFLFTSTSMIYWSAEFLKDITMILICMASVLALIRKRYIIFALLMVYGYFLRPYMIVPVLCYWVLVEKRYKSAWFGAGVSALFVFYKFGFAGIVNSIYTLRFLLFSPNPLNIVNWQFNGFRTFESVMMLFNLLIAVIVFLKYKSSRRFYVISALSIYIYSCVMSANSFLMIAYLNQNASYLSGADDISRKRLMIVIMLYIVFAYSLSKIRKGNTNNSIQIYNKR